MTHRAPTARHDGGDVAATGPAPAGAPAGARSHVRELPPQTRRALDELFRDADRHGPMFRDIVRRSLPALLLFPVALAAAASEPWRAVVLGHVGEGRDLLLVAPVIVALVVLAWALAPLARVSTTPLVLGGMASIGLATILVGRGALVVATVPAAIGATLLGLAAARAMRRAVWALPVLLAAGISDAHSVQGGVTRDLLADVDVSAGVATVEPTLRVLPEAVSNVDFVVLHVPASSGLWVLGMVDVLALALLLGLSHLFWLPLGRTAAALGVALALTMGLGVPMPVLPMLGIAWALVHVRLVWRSTRFSLRRLIYLGG